MLTKLEQLRERRIGQPKIRQFHGSTMVAMAHQRFLSRAQIIRGFLLRMFRI
jgi:hypothetical protein